MSERQAVRRLHAIILDYEQQHREENYGRDCDCDICKAAIHAVIDTAGLCKPRGNRRHQLLNWLRMRYPGVGV
jgi:hypothetical protein